MEFINFHSLSERFNSAFDMVAVIAFWVGLIFMITRYIRKSIVKDDVGKNLYMGIVVCFEASILIFIIYYPLPQILVSLSRETLELATVRWILLYLITISWSYAVSYKKSGWRGMVFVMAILTTLLFGWLYNLWLGVVFMSIPVLSIYLFMISRVAQVILPASNPEDKVEAKKKLQIFLAYLLGVQHPIWMAKGKTEREFEKRLDGNANEIGKPGIIWTWSHQVAGISKGIGFNRVDGPGLIFAEPNESPVALVDLRMQSRICIVNAVTKDGMKVPTVVFTAFAIDKGNSSTTQPRRRRTNGGNFSIDHAEGSYIYSSGRVALVLSTVGINNPRPEEIEKKSEFFWDEWVVNQIEHVTRLVIAERSLDELWHPQHNDRGVSALNEIATRLQELLAPQLTEAGINLITVRVVNYQFTDKDHQIMNRNIKTWGSYWEQKITEANADIEVIRREEIEKAHAYSKSILLSAIAESITKARQINDVLPRHLIAQYYIQALEEYFKGPSSQSASESKDRLAVIKHFLTNKQTEDNE